MALWGEGSEKEQWPLPSIYLGKSCLPALALNADTSYATSAFQAAILALELSLLLSEPEAVSLSEPEWVL